MNLRRISEALDAHDESCTYEVIEIRMAQFEIDRLGWTEILGIPLVADPEQGTGTFRLVCNRPNLTPDAAEHREVVKA